MAVGARRLTVEVIRIAACACPRTMAVVGCLSHWQSKAKGNVCHKDRDTPGDTVLCVSWSWVAVFSC